MPTTTMSRGQRPRPVPVRTIPLGRLADRPWPGKLTDAEFDPFAVDVSMNGVMVCKAGTPHAPVDEVDLTPRETVVLIDLHAGEARGTILSNDLTHDYVHENSAYST
mgnify:CR=1 FL=1